MAPFCKAEWFLPQGLASLEPVDVFHKEYEPKSIELPDNLKNLHILYRKKFCKADGKTVLNISADDYYKVYINRQLVGMGPAQGYYFDYYWNSYDITEYLHDGENEVFADVYYHGLISRSYCSGDRRIGLIAEIVCGETVAEQTGDDWECAFSQSYLPADMIGYDTAFLENYDCRVNRYDWQPAVCRQTDHVFHNSAVKPLEHYTLKPEKSENLPNGALFYDFGQEITGHLKITASGKSGDKIRILHGEETDSNPYKTRFDTRCNCLCDECLTLADGVNTREQYDYKAFRFVTLIPDSGVRIISTEVTVRHYPFDDDYCNLETDNEKLLSVWRICKNGVKYGSQETFVDCPLREKGQYAGDLTVTGAAHVILTGDTSLLKKAIDNQMESAFVCDGLLAVTPGSYMQEIADYSLQFPILALRYYHYSGDRSYLEKNLSVCEKMLSHFERFARGDGLIEAVTDKWNLVDWPQGLRDNYDFELANPMNKNSGCHNVINAFYIGAVMCTEMIRDILGIDSVKKSPELISAFDSAFYCGSTGLYTDSEKSSHSALHSNILPLYFGFCPESSTKRIAEFIMKKGLCCGVYMSYFLLKALCKAGYIDDAYSLIINEGEHSWLNMVKEGATTCFEAWGKNQKINTSLCHPWASAPISVLTENILPSRPEYGKIVYKKGAVVSSPFVSL